ncbi:uncharacterized protein LOC113358985 [Papaver somniferum]|uniref:uncharacterized protein LOC113358985 n=1 Tax=Papaver somniferum TaxID=3469 RepID=UPI000E6F7FDD|nr:uncharacterized protein LOC113358985 [Papaver somniferum]
MKKRNFSLASRCPFCRNEEENVEHIMWKCNHSEILWKWLGDMLCFKNPISFEEIFEMAKHKSSAVKEIWMIAAFITHSELWFMRNECVFEDARFNAQNIQSRILKLTTDSEVRMKCKMWNTEYDLQILKVFNMSRRRISSTRIKEILFSLPVNNQECQGGLGVATNYFAEVMELLCAGEWAIMNGKLKVIFRIDSRAVITAFSSGHIPCYREVNFSADAMAKKGANMARGESLFFTGKPPFLHSMEVEFHPTIDLAKYFI